MAAFIVNTVAGVPLRVVVELAVASGALVGLTVWEAFRDTEVTDVGQ